MHVSKTSGIPPQTWRSSATEGASGNLRTSKPNSAPLRTWLTRQLQRAQPTRTCDGSIEIKASTCGVRALGEGRTRMAGRIGDHVLKTGQGMARGLHGDQRKPGPIWGRVGNLLTRTVQAG